MKETFSCPLSPYIAWHWGLSYKECPLAGGQRDMGYCDDCPLNDNKTVIKRKRKRKKQPVVEKRTKENIPKIGKTYTSK